MPTCAPEFLAFVNMVRFSPIHAAPGPVSGLGPPSRTDIFPHWGHAHGETGVIARIELGRRAGLETSNAEADPVETRLDLDILAAPEIGTPGSESGGRKRVDEAVPPRVRGDRDSGARGGNVGVPEPRVSKSAGLVSRRGRSGDDQVGDATPT